MSTDNFRELIDIDKMVWIRFVAPTPFDLEARNALHAEAHARERDRRLLCAQEIFLKSVATLFRENNMRLAVITFPHCVDVHNGADAGPTCY